MGISEYRATGGKAMLNNYHRKLDSTANFQFNFLPVSKQVYGFDYLGSDNHGIFSTNEFYPKSGSYDFRYKSIETTKTDYVKVDFSNYNGIKDSVIFKDRFGIKLKLSKDNILTFTGTQKPDTNYIYAYDKDGVRIGKLMLKTYNPKTYNLVLVSVNGETLPNTNELKEYLNKIYKQSVTKFDISTTTLKINDLFPFKHGDKKRLSGYNEDQKRVLQAFDSQIKPDINYLFFMPDGVETNGVAGYNPFGYNFGFIYHGAGERTIAHELGHGIASLHHPFNEQSFEKGNTANLMDYNFAEELYHFQWDNIQNPPKRIFKWNFEEEDAEDVGKEYFEALVNNFNFTAINGKNPTFLSPAGMPITLPENTTQYAFVSDYDFCPDGALVGFKTDNKTYVANYSKYSNNTVRFNGYRNLTKSDENSKEFYIDNISKNLTNETDIIIGNKGNGEYLLYQIKYKDLQIDDIQKNNIKGNDYKADGKCDINSKNYVLSEENRINLQVLDKETDNIGIVSFKTEYASMFYYQALENLNGTSENPKDISDEQTIENKKVVWRLAKIFDEKFNGNFNDEQFEDFTNIIIPDYLCDKNIWTLEEYKNFENLCSSSYVVSQISCEKLIKNSDGSSCLDPIIYQSYISKYSLSANYDILIKIITNLSNYTMSFTEENVLLKCLDLIPNGMYNDFFDLLQQNNLMQNLVYHIDGDNYSTFISQLFHYWASIYSQKLDDVNKNFKNYLSDYYVWDDKFFDGIRYKSEFVNNQIVISCEIPSYSIDGDDVSITYSLKSKKKYDWCETIILKLHTIPAFFFDRKYDDIFKDKAIAIPAFLFNAIINKTNLDKWINHADLLITIISFAYEIGELRAISSLSKFEKFMVWFGLATDGYGIISKNDVVSDYLNRIKNDEKNSKVSDLIKWWDHLCNWGDIITKPKFSNFKESFLSFKAGWSTFKESGVVVPPDVDKIITEHLFNLQILIQ